MHHVLLLQSKCNPWAVPRCIPWAGSAPCVPMGVLVALVASCPGLWCLPQALCLVCLSRAPGCSAAVLLLWVQMKFSVTLHKKCHSPSYLTNFKGRTLPWSVWTLMENCRAGADSRTLFMLSFTWVPLSQTPLFSQFVLLKGTQFFIFLELHPRLELGKASSRPFSMRLCPSQHSVGTVWAGVGVCTLPRVRGVRAGTQHRGKVQSSVLERTGNTELLELSFYTTKRNYGLTPCHIFGY